MLQHHDYQKKWADERRSSLEGLKGRPSRKADDSGPLDKGKPLPKSNK